MAWVHTALLVGVSATHLLGCGLPAHSAHPAHARALPQWPAHDNKLWPPGLRPQARASSGALFAALRPTATAATARHLALCLGTALRQGSVAHLRDLFAPGAQLRSAPSFAGLPALQTWTRRLEEEAFRVPHWSARSIRVYPPASVAATSDVLPDALQVRGQVGADPEQWVVTFSERNLAGGSSWQIVAQESRGRLAILSMFER